MKALVLFCIILCIPSILVSQYSISITSCLDNTIYSESGHHSNGQGQFLIVGKTSIPAGNNLRRALIKFNFDVIPSSATITSVELHMQGNSGGPSTIDLHKVTKEWGEGTSDAAGDEFNGAVATPDDATWVYSKYPATTWSAAGGDYILTTSAATVVNAGEDNVFSSPMMVDDVQTWIDGNPNYGWIFIGNETKSGSALSMKSGNIDSGIPFIKVDYDLPERQVIINEINPAGKWIEFYNPGPGSIDVSDWYLCNGDVHEQFQDIGITVLDGALLMPADDYLRVFWNEIGLGSKEVALVKSAAFNNYNVMEDYMQYGSGNQQRAGVAVLAEVWDDKTKFVANPITPGKSLGLKNVNHTSGEDTAWPDWEEQNPTPAMQNICDPFLSLVGNIPSDVYTASVVEIGGTIQMGATVDIFYESSVEFFPEAVIESNVLLSIAKAMCPN